MFSSQMPSVGMGEVWGIYMHSSTEHELFTFLTIIGLHTLYHFFEFLMCLYVIEMQVV